MVLIPVDSKNLIKWKWDHYIKLHTMSTPALFSQADKSIPVGIGCAFRIFTFNHSRRQYRSVNAFPAYPAFWRETWRANSSRCLVNIILRKYYLSSQCVIAIKCRSVSFLLTVVFSFSYRPCSIVSTIWYSNTFHNLGLGYSAGKLHAKTSVMSLHLEL